MRSEVVSTGIMLRYQMISGSGLPVAAQVITACRCFSTTLTRGGTEISGKPLGRLDAVTKKKRTFTFKYQSIVIFALKLIIIDMRCALTHLYIL